MNTRWVLCTALLLPACGAVDEITLRVRLTGAEQVPPVATDARGDAAFVIAANNEAIHYVLNVNADKQEDVGLLGVAGAHIHCAPAGGNGPVVLPLAGPVTGGFEGNVLIQATARQANIIDSACGATLPELIQALRAGRAYVNVHSLANPSGEIRGQIKP
jgi:hypothetical protein